MRQQIRLQVLIHPELCAAGKSGFKRLGKILMRQSIDLRLLATTLGVAVARADIFERILNSSSFLSAQDYF